MYPSGGWGYIPSDPSASPQDDRYPVWPGMTEKLPLSQVEVAAVLSVLTNVRMAYMGSMFLFRVFLSIRFNLQALE